MNQLKGKLHIVATPIGNLDDMTFRAVDVLKKVDLIAAEDTRHSRTLLNHYGINTPLTSLHDHNESRKSQILVDNLVACSSIALICDAGTPLVSDPGYELVRHVHRAGIQIVPIPGPCAAIAALSVSGLATDRFSFEGFLPRSNKGRREKLRSFADVERTLIFYESSHRIRDCLRDICETLPNERDVVIARELTKLHESFIRSHAGELKALVDDEPFIAKGEFVILIAGASPPDEDENVPAATLNVLTTLLQECSLKDAVSLSQKLTGASKKRLYRIALNLKEKP